jgi:selenocysteine lyase/cysteine desulfurase
MNIWAYWKGLLKKRKRLYFDYASVTPVDKRVSKYMNRVIKLYSANPSSLYKDGVEAKKVLESAREEIAKCLEVHADEIIFTSGGIKQLGNFGNSKCIVVKSRENFLGKSQ